MNLEKKSALLNPHRKKHLMRYLITDENNKSWRGETWGENVSHKETNSNYFFWTWKNPWVAAFLLPTQCRDLQKPRLWTCECADLSEIDYGSVSHDYGYCRRYPWVKTIKEQEMWQPSNEQCITFAILCTWSLTENPLVLAWMRNWLLDIDRSPETAKKVRDSLTNEMCQSFRTYKKYYTESAYALTQSVVEPEQTAFYSANSAYRAYSDSFYCLNCGEKTQKSLCSNTECDYSTQAAKGLLFEHLNLQKYADIAKALNTQEIAATIID